MTISARLPSSARRSYRPCLTWQRAFQAAGIARAPSAWIEADLRTGGQEFKNGERSEPAAFFADYAERRSRVILRLKGLIDVDAGERASGDYHRLYQSLLDEPEIDLSQALRDVLRVRAGTGGVREKGFDGLRRGYAGETS